MKHPSIAGAWKWLLVGMLAASFPCSVLAADVHSPLDVAFSPDGKTLAVTDATTPSLVLVDPATRHILRTVPLAGPPSGLVWSADGLSVFVAQSGTHAISQIDPAKGTITRHLKTSRYPRGLALAPHRNLLLAADYGLDQLTVISLASGETTARIHVGRQPTAVAITPDESLALVSNLIPATAATAPDTATEVSVIDLQSLLVRPAIRLPLGSTNTRGIAISGDGRTAYVVHTIGRFNLPTTQLERGWVNTNALSIIDISSNSLSATILLDQVMDGAADPWGLAIDATGQHLLVTLSGVHQLAVIDLPRLPELLKTAPKDLANDLSALARLKLIRRIDLPARGPRGLAISPDGQHVAIAGYFSGNLVITGIAGENPSPISLGAQPEDDLIRQGEAVFHDANRCFQRWLSCASCHPDARADGLNWDLLNDGLGNPKNARSMVWSERTPPMMSHGARDHMGSAVRAGFVHIQFTDPSATDVAAVTAYLKSLQPSISPHRQPDGSLTEAARRGQITFNNPQVGCIQCHPSPLFTDLSLSNVGTSRPFDHGAKQFDTPTLTELWRSPPYLHDGSANTLRHVLVDHNPHNQHGSTSSLTPKQIDDLIAYLLSL